MSETYGPKINKRRVQDPSGNPSFPNSANMGGVRSIEDPLTTFSC